MKSTRVRVFLLPGSKLRIDTSAGEVWGGGGGWLVRVVTFELGERGLLDLRAFSLAPLGPSTVNSRHDVVDRRVTAIAS